MKVSEMFPSKYLTGDDLQGRAVKVTIDTITREKMRPCPGAPEEEKYVLHFDGKTKGLILGKALAESIAMATGSDDTNLWQGKTIVLFPVPMNVAGFARTAIRARKAV